MLNTFIICSRTEKKCKKKYDNNGETAKHTHTHTLGQKQHQVNATTVTVATTTRKTTRCGYKKLRNQKSATKYVVAPNKGANKRQVRVQQAKRVVGRGYRFSRYPVGQKREDK